jgi:hypothetical protein
MHSLQFPLQLSGGLSYLLSEHWLWGIELNWANWKTGYKIDSKSNDKMNDSYRIGVGIEKRPSFSKKEKYTYRAGLFNSQMNMYANFGNINEYGVSIGFGFPLRMQYNRIDFALQAGKRGRMSINLAEETFVRFDISLSASEFWFIRDER